MAAATTPETAAGAPTDFEHLFTCLTNLPQELFDVIKVLVQLPGPKTGNPTRPRYRRLQTPDHPPNQQSLSPRLSNAVLLQQHLRILPRALRPSIIQSFQAVTSVAPTRIQEHLENVRLLHDRQSR